MSDLFVSAFIVALGISAAFFVLPMVIGAISIAVMVVGGLILDLFKKGN